MKQDSHRNGVLFAVWLCLGLLVVIPPALPGDAPSVAAFDFELIDTSLEGELSGPRADEQKRLAMISDQLRGELDATARYTVIDIAPARARIEQAGLLHGCNGCEADIAKDLGADLSISGTVQKVSNLILNINLYVRDAKTSELLRAMSVDIRGNTDESWSRGVSYIVRRRLLKE